jgi:hypothetical protein
MKKRFDIIRSNPAVLELILTAGVLFLLISSTTTLLFKIFYPGTLYPTVIAVISLVGISLYLLPRVKPPETNQYIELDTNLKTVSVCGKDVSNSSVVSILKYGNNTDDRFIIKFPGGVSVDSRTCSDSERLLNLLAKVFPQSSMQYHNTVPMTKIFVSIGLIISLAMFITLMVV